LQACADGVAFVGIGQQRRQRGGFRLDGDAQLIELPQQLQTVTSGLNCSIGPGADQNYLVIVNRERWSAVEKFYWASACIPLDYATAFSVRHHSPHHVTH
jgi:hypothetical protein